jgi:hypothetical protein
LAVTNGVRENAAASPVANAILLVVIAAAASVT